MQTWPDQHPKWRYLVWGNDDLRKRDWVTHDQINWFWARGMWAGVADCMRYELLHEYGGFMPGADCICERPVDELLNDQPDTIDCWAVYESEKAKPGWITPPYAARRGSRFLATVIEAVRSLTERDMGPPWVCVGNKLIGDLAASSGASEAIHVWPDHYFNPRHHTGIEYDGPDKPYGRQMWGSTAGSGGYPT